MSHFSLSLLLFFSHTVSFSQPLSLPLSLSHTHSYTHTLYLRYADIRHTIEDLLEGDAKERNPNKRFYAAQGETGESRKKRLLYLVSALSVFLSPWSSSPFVLL